MIGTILNATAIVAGGVAGLTMTRQLTPETQGVLKLGMGVLTIYVGLSTTWGAIHGSFGDVVQQLTVVMVALMLGNVTGKLLRIQKQLNRLGQFAKEQLASVHRGDSSKFSDGFITCSLLFCVGPMAILGSVQDGLDGNYRTLLIKAAMDGLATMVFVTTFGWGAMLSVIPVVAYQGTITLLARVLAPYLENQSLLDSVNATGGMLVFCISLIILEVKKFELADYLPSLIFAPLLTWWWL